MVLNPSFVFHLDITRADEMLLPNMQLIWAVWSLLYWLRSGLTESYLGHRGFALDERISQGQEFPWHTIRLPRTLFPTSYKITLQTDLKSFNVKGNVTIQVNCEKQTRHIILHLKDMKVSRTAVFETTQRRELFPLKSAGRVKELHGEMEGKQRRKRQMSRYKSHKDNAK